MNEAHWEGRAVREGKKVMNLSLTCSLRRQERAIKAKEARNPLKQKENPEIIRGLKSKCISAVTEAPQSPNKITENNWRSEYWIQQYETH